MIIAEQKPLREILNIIDKDKKLLVIGCGACVSICFAGGEKETKSLADGLFLGAKKEGLELSIETDMALRQCEWEFVEPLEDRVKKADAVISTACGVGVQTMAEKYPEAKIIPGLNTTSMGMPVEQGVWKEYCGGCGDCVLAFTGGLCPVARCAKSLLNGPCGGSKDGICEIGRDTECVWQLIYDRLKGQDRLELIMGNVLAKNWEPARDGGPRRTLRTDLLIRGEKDEEQK